MNLKLWTTKDYDNYINYLIKLKENDYKEFQNKLNAQYQDLLTEYGITNVTDLVKDYDYYKRMKKNTGVAKSSNNCYYTISNSESAQYKEQVAKNVLAQSFADKNSYVGVTYQKDINGNVSISKVEDYKSSTTYAEDFGTDNSYTKKVSVFDAAQEYADLEAKKAQEDAKTKYEEAKEKYDEACAALAECLDQRAPLGEIQIADTGGHHLPDPHPGLGHQRQH